MGEGSLSPLLQLQQLAGQHDLTMVVKPVPRANRVPLRKSFNSEMAVYASADFFWQVVGNPANIAAFLGVAGSAFGAYMAGRGARSVRLKSGDTEVEIKGNGDFEKALATFHALQNKDGA